MKTKHEKNNKQTVSNSEKNSISYKVALGGITASLCLLAMFVSGVVPILYLALPMIAGALMMIIVIEVSREWAFLTYVAVSLLSLLFTFDKEASLIFIVLFGHYPILKFIIDKIKNKFVSFVVKFIVFNVCVIIYFYSAVYILGAEELFKEITRFGKYSLVFILGFVDIVLFLYDYSLGTLAIVYKSKIKSKIR